jgi:hypothetical protein
LTSTPSTTVPEAFRGEYTEKDGKFHLAVTGLEKTYVPRAALTTGEQRGGAAPPRTAGVGNRSPAEDASRKSAPSLPISTRQVQQGQDQRGIRRRPRAAQDRSRNARLPRSLAAERDTAYGVARKASSTAG